MALLGSPTVGRRRLAAELRRLRGKRSGAAVSRGIGWSTTKVSRAESGHESLPPTEIEKLLDFYGVKEPLRGRLLQLAEDATQRGWWGLRRRPQSTTPRVHWVGGRGHFKPSMAGRSHPRSLANGRLH